MALGQHDTPVRAPTTLRKVVGGGAREPPRLPSWRRLTSWDAGEAHGTQDWVLTIRGEHCRGALEDWTGRDRLFSSLPPKGPGQTHPDFGLFLALGLSFLSCQRSSRALTFTSTIVGTRGTCERERALEAAAFSTEGIVFTLLVLSVLPLKDDEPPTASGAITAGPPRISLLGSSGRARVRRGGPLRALRGWQTLREDVPPRGMDSACNPGSTIYCLCDLRQLLNCSVPPWPLNRER